MYPNFRSGSRLNTLNGRGLAASPNLQSLLRTVSCGLYTYRGWLRWPFSRSNSMTDGSSLLASPRHLSRLALTVWEWKQHLAATAY